MADPGRENPPSNNLWIGNVFPDVSDVELKALFEKYGEVDSVTMYPHRNYAFVYFQEVECAKSAMQGLQGHFFHGSPLKIEFAKPAKPNKSLWVAGISPSVSKEELEKEFLRFGKIQELRLLKDRNTAYVDYVRLEDATQSLEAMNGKRMGGAKIRVDYLRSQSSRREQGTDAREGQFPGRSMGPWMGQDPQNYYPEPSFSGSTRQNHLLPIGSDAPPSNVLWIRHPPSVIIEEDMLHNAMILFGEIERIKTFSDRNYAFVEFRSAEEARRAKEGLQGKLFNDPRISIEYSGEFPLQPVQMDRLGHNRPILGHHPPSLGVLGHDPYMRPPLGHQRTFEHAHHGPEFSDFHKLQNPSPQTLMGGPTRKRSSPSSGILSSPPAGYGVPNRPASGAWDVFDAGQHQRDSKRSRIDAAGLTERHGGFDEQYGGGASGSLTRATAGNGLRQRPAERDCIWRGLITKVGSPVCNARCVPLGDGLDIDIPEVVDCSARTGLDLLTQHFEDAIGFDAVFFLPDSVDDFGSYTQFLKFLGSRDRAGVAKFDNGTTMFLVPPSDFLTKVLKISGPSRLYGIVLKFAQVAPPATTTTSNSTSMNVPPLIHAPPHYADPHRSVVNPSQGRVLPLDNSRAFPDDSNPPQRTPGPAAPPAPVVSQAGLALTPELIDTLTKMLPATTTNGLSLSGSQSLSLPQTQHSIFGSTSNVPDNNVAHWKQQHGYHQALDNNNGQHVQQQHLPAAQFVPPQVSNTTSHFNQTMVPYGQVYDRTNSMMAPVIPFQNGQVTGPPQQLNQQYHHNPHQGFYNNPSFVQQQQAYIPNQVQGNDISMQPTQPYMPMPSEVDPTNHGQQQQQQQQAQEGLEADADKNERYKATLLYARSLLNKINQSSSGNQPGQGQ